MAAESGPSELGRWSLGPGIADGEPCLRCQDLICLAWLCELGSDWDEQISRASAPACDHSCQQKTPACQHILLASMATITVRGLGADELAALKQEAEREGISMNRLALRRLLDQPPAATMTGPSALDALAGTWSQQEADAFQAAIAPLEQVDPDLWG